MLTTTPQPTTTTATTGHADGVVMDAALHVLIALNLVQLAAGFLDANPSPPDAVQPLIAATAAAGIAARALVRAASPVGSVIAIAVALVSMIGMGPHKLLLDDGLVIAPVALVGFAAEITVIVLAARHLRSRS